MGTWLIHDEINRLAHWKPDQTAFVFEDAEYTYENFLERVNQVSHTLRDKGVDHGDGILAHGLNHIDLFTLFFACSKIGAIFSTISKLHSESDAKHIANSTPDSKFIFYTLDEEIINGLLPYMRENLSDYKYVSLDENSLKNDLTLDDMISESPMTNPKWEHEQDARSIHHTSITSGTTGSPKIALWNHRDTLHFSQTIDRVFPYEKTDQWLTDRDMCLARAPYSRDGLEILASGGTIHILRQFNPSQLCTSINDWDINGIALGFTQAQILLDYISNSEIDICIDNLQAVVTNKEMAKSLYDISNNLYNRFAGTEIGAPLIKKLEPPFDKDPALGIPRKGFDVRVIPVDSEGELSKHMSVASGIQGELVCRGEGTMSRYLHDKNQNKHVEKGWIFTGDIVRVNQNFELTYVDRLDNRIRSGGLNVYPSKIKNVLDSHPDVKSSFIVGVDDDRWGERVCALIVPSTKKQIDILRSELDSYCIDSKDISNEIRPREYEFESSFNDIPTGPYGKIDKQRLVSKYFS